MFFERAPKKTNDCCLCSHVSSSLSPFFWSAYSCQLISDFCMYCTYRIRLQAPWLTSTNFWAKSESTSVVFKICFPHFFWTWVSYLFNLNLIFFVGSVYRHTPFDWRYTLQWLGSVRWGMIKFKIAILRYELVNCRTITVLLMTGPVPPFHFLPTYSLPPDHLLSHCHNPTGCI